MEAADCEVSLIGGSLTLVLDWRLFFCRQPQTEEDDEVADVERN